MGWFRKAKAGASASGDAPTGPGETAPLRTAEIKSEARIELVEDGRVVYSQPVFELPSFTPPSGPLRDVKADLRAGRGLAAGGFVALDFETATRERDSACAVALAAVEGGRVTDVERWLIQPPGNEYEGFNTSIHGITAAMTADSGSMAEVWPEVQRWMDGRPLVMHYAPFDLSVLRHSLHTGGMDGPELTYHCTCALARRAWPGRLSYRLPDLASECGIVFQHHEPGADATTAGELAIACCGMADTATVDDACEALGMLAGHLTGQAWSPNTLAGVRPADLKPTVDSIPEDSEFRDRLVVFTGTLSCGLTRREAWQLLVNAGGTTASSVSKKVNYLVLGTQDGYRLKDGEHSTKMLKAAELRAAGQPIELLAEVDFLRMLPAELLGA